MTNETNQQSYFDGGLLQLIGWTFLSIILIACTFGLGYPWAICFLYGWKINHTIVGGKRLKFVGNGMSLFGNWIKWFFLTIITFGVYGFWVGIAIEKWKIKNTIFENQSV